MVQKLADIRAVLDLARDAAVVLAPDGRVLDVNEAALRVYGYARDEIRRLRVHDLRAPQIRAITDAQLWVVLSDGARFSSLNVRKDGTVFPVEVSARSCDTADGRVILAMVRDMSEHVAMTEALRRSAASFRALLDQNPCPIALQRDERVVYGNAAWCALLGYESPSDVVGRSIYDDIDPTQHASVREAIRAGVGAPVRTDRRWVRRDGAKIDVEITVVRVDLDDGPTNVVVARDRTDERRLARQLQVADRMASIGTLVSGVAHEINNPLAYVITNLEFAGVALGDVDHPAIPEVREALDEAAQGAHRVRAIVQELRTFAINDVARPAVLDLATAVESAMRMVGGKLRTRARFVREHAPAPLVHADPTRLTQVLVHVIVNALQALGPDTAKNEVTLATGTTGGGEAFALVRDNGSGIAEKDLGRIFDPFFTTKAVGEGTGLGLSIVHNLVQEMGGRVEVETRVGEGSTFRVVLPATALRPPASASFPPPPPSVELPEDLNVLVVDDEPLVGQAIRRVLPRCIVTVITSAQDALARIEAGESFDVVVCDLSMPQMGGERFLDELQRVAPSLARRAIVTTGGAPGATRYAQLPKPFAATELRTVLAANLKK